MNYFKVNENVENDHRHNQKFEQRSILQYDEDQGIRLLDYARKIYQKGIINEAFDIYEQLTIAYPSKAIEILSELYDQYKKLKNADRYLLYQSRFYNFGIKPSDTVLDIGSGNIPFHLATHLVDLTIENNNLGRAGAAFKHVSGLPIYECNIEKLPFDDNEFDFVYCSHVLEHVINPDRACSELMRVGKRGFIESPTRGKDRWLNTAKVSNHRWAIEKNNNKLIFTEYTPEEIEGLQNNILMDMHNAPQTPREKAFSALIYLKANKINTMLLWKDSFKYEIHYKNQKCILNMKNKSMNLNFDKNFHKTDNSQRTSKDKYDKLWQIKLNDRDWLKNDGKGRVEYCAHFIKSNLKFNVNNKLLDVGCGRGTLAHFLNLNLELYGIDISPAAVDEANKIYKEATQIDLDKEALPYANNFFDCVVALDVLEHVYDPQYVLNEIYRVLNVKGKLVLSTPNILYEKYLKELVHKRRFPKTSFDHFPYDGGHIHFFTYEDIFLLLKQSDFRASAIGPTNDKFDYEFKESTVWVMAEKSVEHYE